MKSDRETLRRRGQAEVEDIEDIRGYSRSELESFLRDTNPVRRMAAAHILGDFVKGDIRLAECIIHALHKEKCLYTRLELCTALEKGDVNTARVLTKWLGRIGKNQHKEVPERVSAKKSYPLARDIIARTLANMAPEIMPALLECLRGGQRAQVTEALDAFGFLVFYHQELATEQNEAVVLAILDLYRQDDLIRWKCILCLSAFPLRQSMEVLNRYLKEEEHPVIRDEAGRSLALITSRSQN